MTRPAGSTAETVPGLDWPGWYRYLLAGGLLIAGTLALANWLIGPRAGFLPLTAAICFIVLPAVVALAIFAGDARHPGRLILASLVIDLEAVLLSGQLTLGLAYAVIFPVIGVAFAIPVLKGRRGYLVVAIAAVATFIGVALSYGIGPASEAPRMGLVPISLLNLAMFVALGFGYIGLLSVARTQALEHARAELASREAAEVERDRTAKLLNAIVTYTPVPTYAFDTEGLITLWNPACERVYGWKSDEVLGRPQPSATIPESDRETSAERIRRTMAGEVIHGDRIRRLGRDGREVWLDIYASAMYDADGTPMGIAGQLVNVTDRIALEERLRQAAKMEAIGVLAGGVAHDFNNMLTAIRGYAELARAEVPAGDGETNRDLRTDVEEIIRAADRAADLTRQLLAFARKSVVEPRKQDVAAVIDEFAPMLRRLVGEHIQVTLDLAPDSTIVKADPSQLQQVVLNLVVNARDAMPEGGRLTLSTRRVSFAPADLAAHPDAEVGEYARLSVTDNGHGMDEATRRRAFEPFFTTKEPGQGTGMGLATVFGIADMCDGWVELESQVGVGTTASLYLPRLVDAAKADDAAEAPAPIPRGDETILLVEDDPAVRWFGRRCLESLGYSVMEAANGTDALTLAGCFPGQIDLLITDVVMPGMQGPELARQIGELRPGIHRILCSGFALAEGDPGAESGDTAFLAKPYTRAGIGKAVRDALDATS